MKQTLHRHLCSLLYLGVFCSGLSLSAQTFLISDGDISGECAGSFFDSGGQNAGYGINEDFTISICPNLAFPSTGIRLSFAGIDVGATDLFEIYDGPTVDPATQFDGSFLANVNQAFAIEATANNTSGCLTIVFQSDDTDEGNTGWIATISCVAACQPIEAVLVGSDPMVSPPDTGYIDVCPGQEITLEAMGIYPQNGNSYTQSDALSRFDWVLGDGTTTVGPSIRHTYGQPGGYNIQLTITDTMGCRNSNYLSRRVRVSPYPIFDLDDNLDPTICADQQLKITSSVDAQNPANLTVSPSTQTFSPPGFIADTVFLPDGTGTSYFSSLLLNQFEEGATLDNVADLESLSLNMEHSF
ncbi:MAG: PKD domain-containing protein, partial [Bacteroidota bacterium]